MSIKKIILSLIFISILCFGSGLSSAQIPVYPVIRISTASHFIESIGSNRMLLLNSGTINLSDITNKQNTDYIQWVDDPDQSFIIKNVENLTIAGQGRKKTRIVIEETFAQVLSFENSKKIRIQSLELGHEPQTNSICLGAVFGAFDSSDIELQNVVLFGSGTFGLWLENVDNLRFKNSTIKECSQGLIWAYQSKNIEIYRSRLKTSHGGLNFSKSSDIAIDASQISDNNALESPDYTSYLFSLKDVKNFKVTNTEVFNNVARGLIKGRAEGEFILDVKEAKNQYE